jgi:hypothetical protein
MYSMLPLDNQMKHSKALTADNRINGLRIDLESGSVFTLYGATPVSGEGVCPFAEFSRHLDGRFCKEETNHQTQASGETCTENYNSIVLIHAFGLINQSLYFNWNKMALTDYYYKL